MQPDAEDVHVTHAMLREMPMADRLSALVCSIVEENPGAGRSVAAIIALTGIMARCLPHAERLAISWLMLEEIEKINAKWN
jgi:hypothetical protein